MWGEGVLCFMIKHNNIRDIIKHRRIFIFLTRVVPEISGG